jgi:RNA-directed DNA polymerase
MRQREGIEPRNRMNKTRRILAALYEPAFLDPSDGFRPAKSCHDGLRQLNQEVMSQPVNWIVDLDLAQFFDTMPHGEILAVMGQRIKDKKFLSLIARLLKAGVETPGGGVPAELGSPQGSIVSPVIANIYLDKGLDQWMATVVKRHCRGYCMQIRYADDSIVGFECADDAQRFMQVLPKRLTKYGLRLNAAKTHLIEFGNRQARQGLRAGGQLPTLDFLGFTHYWGRSRKGQVRLKRKTAKKRLRRALMAINHWLRQPVRPTRCQPYGKPWGGSCEDISTTLGSPIIVGRFIGLNGQPSGGCSSGGIAAASVAVSPG